MKKYLWQAGDGKSVDEAIMEFMAGEDVVLDRELFPFDIRATAAHVRGLQRIGVLGESECERLVDLLGELAEAFDSGQFVLDGRYEDGHSAIEMFLTEKAGDAGAKVHTGRSRNDQVAVATRLYLKDRLGRLLRLNGRIAESCLAKAERYAGLPMPGYTHLQRAVPSSVGLWMGAFAEAFTDDVALARGALELIDCSPLGTAAGYGVNLALDRDGVAADLGFGRLQVNPMYAQNSRGKYEILALQAALHAMDDLRRLAWDLSLFTTAEFGFVVLPAEYTTGSSIMPNKANPDVVELLRARAATTAAAVAEIQSLLSLPSGYQPLAIVPNLVDGLGFREERMREAISADMFATDIALERAARGVPFRTAYTDAKRELGKLTEPDAAASLAQRVSPGGCANLLLDRIRERLREERERAGKNST